MSFRDDLQKLINQHSMENISNTPDFILAEYLAACLEAFDKAVIARDKWYGDVLGSRSLFDRLTEKETNED